VEYLDSFEVFYAFYWGMVFELQRDSRLLIRSLVGCGRAPEPRTYGVDQSLGRLLSFDPHAPFFRKEEGWGTSYYPRLGEFRRSPTSY
jgi:hypothetical protein